MALRRTFRWPLFFSEFPPRLRRAQKFRARACGAGNDACRALSARVCAGNGLAILLPPANRKARSACALFRRQRRCRCIGEPLHQPVDEYPRPRRLLAVLRHQRRNGRRRGRAHWQHLDHRAVAQVVAEPVARRLPQAEAEPRECRGGAGAGDGDPGRQP